MAIPASGRNLTVIARNEADGLYYSGFITSFIADNDGLSDTYPVHFHSIRPQKVQRNHVIVVGGATPWPELKVGDFVLTKIRCKTTTTECYVPGIVVGTPLDLHIENRFFTVRLLNGQKTIKQRACIVKIGPERYKNILDYILRYRASMLKNSGQKLLRRQSISQTELLKRRVRPPSTPLVPTYRRRRRSSSRSGRRSKRSDKERTQTDQRSLSSRSSATSSVVSLSSNRSSCSRKSTDSRHSVSSRYSIRNARTTPIKKDTVVLARWLDDGWFYFGRIATEPDIDDEEEMYTVVDANDHREMIKREDIFTDEEHLFESVQPFDCVIALHPDYVFSYAPAIVTEVYDHGVQVHFYDDKERKLLLSEVYVITSMKYKKYVAYIDERMSKLSGNVVARDDKTGIYKQYIAAYSDHRAQQVYLKLPNNSYKKQLAIHVFPMETSTRYNEQSWQYVLAPLDTSCTAYYPARVTSTNPVRLTYYDGTTTDKVELNQCFFTNENYYKNAAQYLMNNFKQE